ncbi:AtpZ/AtpI family protein [Thermoflavimicrobium daqui]|uniref:AtpZ/AtpI family protein n=1 Tax=Thermoflavimicrobium daqui TaxID=2137476 RepID=UPI00143CE59A|nr:AtpZ/AtpI family protein [Thermoflavimicrobium daqui]
MKNSQGNFWRMAAMVGTLGMEVIFLTIGGAWLGKWLDSIFSTKPIMLAVGILLGLTLGFVIAGYTLKGLMKE